MEKPRNQKLGNLDYLGTCTEFIYTAHCTLYNDVTALASVVEHAAAMTSAHARKLLQKTYVENVSPARYGDITLQFCAGARYYAEIYN